MSAAAETLTGLRHELADAVAKAGDLDAAQKAIAAVRRKHGNSNAIADALFVPIAMADLAGRLMVYEHEAPAVLEMRSGARPQQFALGDSQPLEAFLNLPWDEAVAYITDRGVVSEEDFAPLLKGYTEQTKDARRALLAQIQTRTYELLTQAVERGDSFADFADALAEDADGLGITSQDPAYLQTVFRTNVLSAYGAGRHEAMSDPAVVEARPYRMLRNAGDGRVGDDHEQFTTPWGGIVFEASGPLGDLRTPLRWNCRCAIVSLSEPPEGAEIVTSLPPGAVAPGFGGR